MLNDLLEFIQKSENITQRLAEETAEWQTKDEKNQVYLYGGGALLQNYFRYLSKYNIKITAILDTFKDGEYRGIPVCRYDRFLNEAPSERHCRFFVSSTAYAKEIVETLDKKFPRENIYVVDTAFQLGTEEMSLQEYRDYLTSNWKEITVLFSELADEKSKETLINVLREHVTGNTDYMWDTLDPDLTYSRDVITFTGNEVFVEPGAFYGDNFLDFVNCCPQYKAAYLFEPESSLQGRLHEIAEHEKAKGKAVHVIQKGVWDSETTLDFFSTGQGTGSFVLPPEHGEIVPIPTTTLDKAVPEHFTYLKMDIEGSELHALMGASKHIQVSPAPKMAICVYHKMTDLLDIWHYLRSLVPGYRFYLRNHTLIWDDVILYAI